MISSILQAYGIDYKYSLAEPLTSGLINRTWKVSYGEEHFILQQINNDVFKKPFDLAENIRLIDHYLNEHSPGYLFVAPVKTVLQQEIVYNRSGYFRLFPFVKDSHTINVVATADQAFEAALQFGKFTRLLAGFDTSRLHITIPDFHNLILRYNQFETALSLGNPERIRQAENLISDIRQHYQIVHDFEKIQKNKIVRLRVTHHDTKISNVLFNSHGKGICVIDLDTVMPGYFISDVGDMMRTYLSPANEEEKDFSKIDIREDFFRAIVQGYLNDMDNELTRDEHGLILYSGLFMVYMQAIRFLTDYINNDQYYGANYEGHNFVRAGNQMTLLKRLKEKETSLQKIIAEERKRGIYFSLP